MKIQLAIDRVSLDKAKEIAKEALPYIDIIEVGTSLIKDFGYVAIETLKSGFPNKIILADMKTIDEGEYEFETAFRHGADIATVMGAASVETIEACNLVTRQFNKTMMIDLLEVSEEKIQKLEKFGDAIFCIHTSTDKKSDDVSVLLKEFRHKFPGVRRIAVAGGVNYGSIGMIKDENVEIVIIGGAITKAEDIRAAAKQFREMI